MSTGGGPDPEELRQLRQQLAGLYDQLMEAGRRLERLEQTAARPAASVGHYGTIHAVWRELQSPDSVGV